MTNKLCNKCNKEKKVVKLLIGGSCELFLCKKCLLGEIEYFKLRIKEELK